MDRPRLHLLFPPTLAVRSNITCKEEKDAIRLVLFYFFCFRSAPHFLLLRCASASSRFRLLLCFGRRRWLMVGLLAGDGENGSVVCWRRSTAAVMGSVRCPAAATGGTRRRCTMMGQSLLLFPRCSLFPTVDFFGGRRLIGGRC